MKHGFNPQRQPENPTLPISGCPMPIFCQSRRFAAYHEQGEAPCTPTVYQPLAAIIKAA